MAKRNLRKNIRIANYGLAGVVTGTAAGWKLAGGKPGVPATAKQLASAHMGARVGAITGVSYGIRRENRRFGGQVPAIGPTTGPRQFKNRVGTKTQGRVGRGGLQFNPSSTMEHGDADVGAV